MLGGACRSEPADFGAACPLSRAKRPLPRANGPLSRTKRPLGHVAVGLTGLLTTAICVAQDGGAHPAEYRPKVARILELSAKQTDAWEKMQVLCDDIGHRLSGSPAMERAVAWAVEALRGDGHENVRAEKVMVPKWVRGAESLALIEPYARDIPMLGLGGSVGTPPEGITAPVVCVSDQAELERLGDAVRGKIVLFNAPMSTEGRERGAGYSTAVRYRSNGPRWAARNGAVACLIRSVATASLQSPHTGATGYDKDAATIPAAAISIEFAEQFARMQARGATPVVRLKMEARDHGLVESANVVAELTGRERPEEIVLIGAHLDSWDVGHGAHDDAGGCVSAMQALTVLRQLDLPPRRTIRVVLYTNEENGLAGGKQYVRDHEAEMDRHVAAIESDSGVFRLMGFGLDHVDPAKRDRAVQRLAAIVDLMQPLGKLHAVAGGGGADIGPMKPHGVPLIGVDADMTHYFDLHHSHADTLDKVNPAELNQHVAGLAALAYVLAEMPARIDAE